MSGIDDLRARILKAKIESSNKYVVCVQKNEKIDMELMIKILSNQDVMNVALSIDNTKLLFICRTPAEAHMVKDIFNEAFGYCATII